MEINAKAKVAEILLVEDNFGDVRLTVLRRYMDLNHDNRKVILAEYIICSFS